MRVRFAQKLDARQPVQTPVAWDGKANTTSTPTPHTPTTRLPARLHTIGHGTLPEEEFLTLLRRRGIERLVDVRSFPGSRRNPQYGREAMAGWLPDAGVGYEWEQRLGGRRRKVVEHSRHTAWREEAFRSYADWMETAEFRAGLVTLLDGGAPKTAFMCSESLWWRCHRRLIADHLVLVEGIEVLHLMHDGRDTLHQPMAEARVEGGNVVYDGGALPLQ